MLTVWGGFARLCPRGAGRRIVFKVVLKYLFEFAKFSARKI
jgi:hypothetical protein